MLFVFFVLLFFFLLLAFLWNDTVGVPAKQKQKSVSVALSLSLSRLTLLASGLLILRRLTFFPPRGDEIRTRAI